MVSRFSHEYQKIMFSEVPPEINPRKSLSVSPATRLPAGQHLQASLVEAALTQSRDLILLVESDTPDISRLLGWEGKAEQAADLADALCRLPLQMYDREFPWTHFERSLEDYQQRYPDRQPTLDYVRLLSHIRDLRASASAGAV